MEVVNLREAIHRQQTWCSASNKARLSLLKFWPQEFVANFQGVIEQGIVTTQRLEYYWVKILPTLKPFNFKEHKIIELSHLFDAYQYMLQEAINSGPRYLRSPSD
jgi:hypothetical protein